MSFRSAVRRLTGKKDRAAETVLRDRLRTIEAAEQAFYDFGDSAYDDVRMLHEDTLAALAIPIEHFAARNCNSQNYTIFCKLKLMGFAPRNILEIGTAWGATTRYLHHLFRDAMINTVDLPKSHPKYAIKDPRQEQVIAEVAALDRITSLRISSSQIPGLDLPPMDLVWLDGDHSSPVVFQDLYTAHFLLGGLSVPGRYLVIDDLISAREILGFKPWRYFSVDDDVQKSLDKYMADTGNDVLYVRRKGLQSRRRTPARIGLVAARDDPLVATAIERARA